MYEVMDRERGGNFIARKGTEVEYMGKKYVSLRELSRELDIPYSPLAHRYYRKKDIEESVAWVEKSKKKNKLYSLWGRKYKSINEIALYFGLNPDPIRVRLNEKLSLEEAISELLKKETIQYEGKEF